MYGTCETLTKVSWTSPTTKLPPPRNDASCGAQFGVARRFIMVHGSQCRTATRLWVENVKSNHPPQSKPFMHVFHTAACSSSDNQSFPTIKQHAHTMYKANQREVNPRPLKGAIVDRAVTQPTLTSADSRIARALKKKRGKSTVTP